MSSDTERLDFLQSGKWTRWVGYNSKEGGWCVWPVFQDGDLRENIDLAMEVRERQENR